MHADFEVSVFQAKTSSPLFPSVKFSDSSLKIELISSTQIDTIYWFEID